MPSDSLVHRLSTHLAATRLDRDAKRARTASAEGLAAQLEAPVDEVLAALLELLPTGKLDVLVLEAQLFWRDLARAARSIDDLVALIARVDATTRTSAGTEIYNPFLRSTKSLSEVAYDGWNKTLEEALRRLLPSIPVPLGEGTLRAIAALPSPARFAMRFSLARHGTIADPRWSADEIALIGKALVRAGAWCPQQLEGIERTLGRGALAEAAVRAAPIDHAEIGAEQLALIAPACSPEKLFTIGATSFRVKDDTALLDAMLDLLPESFVDALDGVADDVPPSDRGEYLERERLRSRAAFAVALLSRRAIRKGETLGDRHFDAAAVAVRTLSFGDTVLAAMAPEARDRLYARAMPVHRPYLTRFPSVFAATWVVDRVIETDHDWAPWLVALRQVGAEVARERLGEATKARARQAISRSLGMFPSPQAARALARAFRADGAEAWVSALRSQRAADGVAALRELAAEDRGAALQLAEKVLADYAHAPEAEALARELALDAPVGSAIHAIAATGARPDIAAGAMLLAPRTPQQIAMITGFLGARSIAPFLEKIRWEDQVGGLRGDTRVAMLRTLGAHPDERSVPVPEIAAAIEAVDPDALGSQADRDARAAAVVLARMSPCRLGPPPADAFTGSPLIVAPSAPRFIDVAGDRVAVSTGTALFVHAREAGALVREIALGPDEAALLAAQGEVVVLKGEASLEIVDVPSGKRRRPSFDASAFFTAVVGARGDRLALLWQEGQSTGVRFVDARTGRAMGALDLEGMPRACAPLPDGAFVVMDDDRMIVTDPKRAAIRAVVREQPEGEDGFAGVIAWPFARGRRIALVAGSVIEVYGIEDGERWTLVARREGYPAGASFHGGTNSDVVAIATQDGEVTFIDERGVPSGRSVLPEGFETLGFAGGLLMARRGNVLCAIDPRTNGWAGGVALPAAIETFAAEPEATILIGILDGQIVRWWPGAQERPAKKGASKKTPVKKAAAKKAPSKKTPAKKRR